MKGPRTVRDARRETHAAAVASIPSVEGDVRRVVPRWHEVSSLIEGARVRGWTQGQIDYLTSVVGITWAKAFRAGQLARPDE